MAGKDHNSRRMNELGPSLLHDLNLAIESDASEAVRSLYRRFGLSQRGIGFAQFRKHVFRRRKKVAKNPAPTKISDRPVAQRAGGELNVADLGRAAMREIQQKLNAGGVKPYVLINLVRLTLDAQLVDIKRQAEERAAELHEIKIEQLSKELRRNVAERTEGGKTLSRNDVYDMIDKVMRGEQ